MEAEAEVEAAAVEMEAEAEVEAATVKMEAEAEAPVAAAVTGMAATTHDLSYVEGIGAVYAGKLKEVGIDTPQALLEKGATPKGRKELAESTGISGHLILKWVNHVDLYRITGLGAEYADLLEASGVDTVPELAQRNPGNLHNKVIEVNKEKHLVRHVPSQSQINDWVNQAKQLPRVISY
jgi:predicted flap endonuclease-1-like 5' DNA nuclease